MRSRLWVLLLTQARERLRVEKAVRGKNNHPWTPRIPDSTKDNNIIMMGIIKLLLITKSGMGKAVGAFHSDQNSGNFSWYTKINGTDHFGLVWLEYSEPALKVVLFDWSGHFGQTDWNVPFHLTKLLSPVLLFCILLTRTITKRVVALVSSVQPEYGIFKISNQNFCWMESAPCFRSVSLFIPHYPTQSRISAILSFHFWAKSRIVRTQWNPQLSRIFLRYENVASPKLAIHEKSCLVNDKFSSNLILTASSVRTFAPAPTPKQTMSLKLLQKQTSNLN